MPTLSLTKKTVAALRLPEGKTDVEFWDDKLKGFGVRVRPGSATFFFYYRSGVHKRRIKLGPATDATLDGARDQAAEYSLKVGRGEDPAVAIEQAKQRSNELIGPQFQLFIEKNKKDWTPHTTTDATRYLNVVAKGLHKLPVAAVTQVHIVALLDDAANNSGDVTANRLNGSPRGTRVTRPTLPRRPVGPRVGWDELRESHADNPPHAVTHRPAAA